MEKARKWLPHILIYIGIYFLTRSIPFAVWIDELPDQFKSHRQSPYMSINTPIVVEQVRALGYCLLGYGALLLVVDAVKSLNPLKQAK